jgi:hypothetical protein
MTRLCGDRGALANVNGFSSPRNGRLTSGRQLEERDRRSSPRVARTLDRRGRPARSCSSGLTSGSTGSSPRRLEVPVLCAGLPRPIGCRRAAEPPFASKGPGPRRDVLIDRGPAGVASYRGRRPTRLDTDLALLRDRAPLLVQPFQRPPRERLGDDPAGRVTARSPTAARLRPVGVAPVILCPLGV